MQNKKRNDSNKTAQSKTKAKLDSNSSELGLLSNKKSRTKKNITNNIESSQTNTHHMQWLNIEEERKRIRYVAFGDSITAGFNPELGGFSAPGKMEEDKTISGLSYPAFFASFLKQIHPLMISSFENFGLSGTRIDDWLYILGVEPETYNYDHSEVYFKFLQNLDAHPNNPFPYRIKKQFHGFGKIFPHDFDHFHQKLQDASLVTLTLGANDLIWYFIDNFDKIMQAFLKTRSLDALQPFLNKILKQIELRLTQLVNKVKTITGAEHPSQINLLSYPLPFFRIVGLLDQFVHYPTDKIVEELNGNHIPLFGEYILHKLNSTIAKVAKKTKVNYIDIYNSNFWKEFDYLTASYFYDLHPTTKGYKRIAQELMMQLYVAPNQDFSPYEEEIIIENHFYNYIHPNKKTNKTHQLASLPVIISGNDIVHIVLGNLNKKKLELEFVLEQNDKELETKQLKAFKNIPLSTTPVYNLAKAWIDANPIEKFQLNFDFQENKNKINTFFQKIVDFLRIINGEKKDNFYALIQLFIETHYLDKLVLNVQKQFFDKLQMPGTIDWKDPECRQLFYKTVLDNAFEPNVVFGLIQTFLASEFFDPEKINVDKLSDGINQSIDVIFPYLAEAIFSVGFKKINLNHKDLNQFFYTKICELGLRKALILEFIHSRNQFLEAKNFQDYLAIFLNSSSKEIQTFIIDTCSYLAKLDSKNKKLVYPKFLFYAFKLYNSGFFIDSEKHLIAKQNLIIELVKKIIDHKNDLNTKNIHSFFKILFKSLPYKEILKLINKINLKNEVNFLSFYDNLQQLYLDGKVFFNEFIQKQNIFSNTIETKIAKDIINTFFVATIKNVYANNNAIITIFVAFFKKIISTTELKQDPYLETCVNLMCQTFFTDNQIQEELIIISNNLVNQLHIYFKQETFQDFFILLINKNEKPVKSIVAKFLKRLFNNKEFAHILAKLNISILKLENINKEDFDIFVNIFLAVTQNIESFNFFEELVDFVFKFLQQNNAKLLMGKNLQDIILTLLNSPLFTNLKKKIFIFIADTLKSHTLDTTLFAKYFNLLFDKSPLAKTSDMNLFAQPLYYGLTQIKNVKMNIINLESFKFKNLGKAISIINNSFYTNFVQWQNEHPQIHYKENPYYKTIFRLTILCLWHSWNYLFLKKNISRKIFWNKISLIKNIDIQSQIFKFLTNNAKDKSLVKLIKEMYGNTSSFITKKSKYKPNDLLIMIFYHSQNPKYLYDPTKSVEEHILDLLKHGNDLNFEDDQHLK